MATETNTIMVESTTGDGDSEANVTRFLLAVDTGKRQCYVQSFELLYRALGQGRSFATLQQFLVDVLGWEKEQLDNLQSIAGASGSSDEDFPFFKADIYTRQISEQNSSVFSEPSTPGGENDCVDFYSVENASLPPLILEGRHLIQCTRNTFQKSHSVPRENQKKEAISNSFDDAILEQLQSEDKRHTVCLSTPENLEVISQVMEKGRQSPLVTPQQPRKKSQSFKEKSDKTPQSRIQQPRKIPQHLKEKDQKPHTRPTRPRRTSESWKETNSVPQNKPNPSRKLSLCLKETNKKPFSNLVLKETTKKPSSNLETPRKTSQSLKEASRIPQIGSGVERTVSQSAKKDGQRHLIRPDPRKVSKSSEDENNKKSPVKEKEQERAARVSVHIPKSTSGMKLIKKQPTEDHASSKQEDSCVTPFREGMGRSMSPKQFLKEPHKRPQSKLGTTRLVSQSHRETSQTPFVKSGLTRNVPQPMRKVDQSNHFKADPRKINQKSLVKTTSQVRNVSEADNVATTNEESQCSLTKEETGHVSLSDQENSTVTQLDKEMNHDSLSVLESGSDSLSEHKTNQVQSTKENSPVALVSQEMSLISMSKQKTNDTSLSKQDISKILEPNQETVYVTSSSQETLQAAPLVGNIVDIASIVDEANQALKQPGLTKFSAPSAEPHANQLPQKVLLHLLTVAFPQLPLKAKELIQQLEQFSSIVCFRDVEFSDEQLCLRLQDFIRLIEEMVSVVIVCCREVTTKHIKETSDKLRTSKKKLRSVQKDYEGYLSWVIQTRQELKVAERDLHEAKVKNVKVLRVYSRSQSQESKECNDSTKTIGSCAHIVDFESDSLADEANVQDTEAECHAVADDSDSLLASVLKEIVAIEKKHRSASEHDRNLKKVLRTTRESVIETKKEVRNRLQSNVSAEEEAITKEDILYEKQTVTRKFSKQIKNLQNDYKALQVNESVIVSLITNDIEAVRTMEVDEKTLNLGRLDVQALREQKSGRLLMESRQEAVAFASLVKVPDLGEWLMLNHDVTKQIQQVYSRLRVNNSQSTVDILDVVGASDKDRSVVVLCGPAGSGKTCMCHYLLHRWKSNKYLAKSRLHQLDLVLYCTMGNIIASGSWGQYLKEHIFCTTLNDFPNLDIHEALATMSVLFIIDASTLTPTSSKILKEIFTHLGKNNAVVTSRSGSEADIVEVAKSNDLSCLSAQLCPMTPDAVRDYSSNLISFFEQKSSSVDDKVNQFTELLQSMNATDSLLYPLPLAYLMYLWRVDPDHVIQAKTLSRLFREVVIVCEHTLTEVLRVELGGDSGAAKVRAEQHTQQLYEAAWKQVSHKDWPHHSEKFLYPQHQLLKEQTVFSKFAPLLVIREGEDGRHHGNLPHHLLAEVLCGFYLARQRLCPSKGSPLFRRRERLERYCIPDIKRFRYVLPHTAGAFLSTKHTVEDAREVVLMYSKSLSEERDMVSWLVLLQECDFLSAMCTAVSEILARYSCWTTSQYSQQNNCAVADLLKRGAYQPQQVVISQTVQGGVNCIIHALSTCSSTLVRLRQDAQFYSWGEAETCDSLVVPLQPPGTLLECWGHLGMEGAMALRHSHHLEELNVRISSCKALSALVRSMDHLRRSLRYLYLRLDLQPSATPLSSLQPLNFKGKQLWLRVRGISDTSINWLKNLIKILNGWYTEVVLEESSLSPAQLQALKESMPQTSVHISG